MYGVKVYITPEDVLNKLSTNDRNKFDQCVFTDVVKSIDGSIEISCLLFNDNVIVDECRYRLESDLENKVDFEKVVKERDKAIEFIKYLDKNYSSYMTEDERFEEWR